MRLLQVEMFCNSSMNGPPRVGGEVLVFNTTGDETVAGSAADAARHVSAMIVIAIYLFIVKFLVLVVFR